MTIEVRLNVLGIPLNLEDVDKILDIKNNSTDWDRRV